MYRASARIADREILPFSNTCDFQLCKSRRRWKTNQQQRNKMTR